jgi:hypothetical protein
MLNAHFKPLHQWQGDRTKERKSAQFKASWLQTLDLLEYELDRLDAHHVVVQIEDPEQHKTMRNDGSMTVAGKYWPTKPGVVLMFESPKGNISMPCDRYNHWRDNLRAIALSLEALRAVDRYGVTRGNEQYRGWTQIEAPSNGKMTREQALVFLASLTGSNAVALDEHWSTVGEAMLKRAKKLHHPDAPGGSHEMFVKIGQAEEVLCG